MSTVEVKRAIVSRPTEGEFLRMVGRIKITSEQTNGAFEVFELDGPGSPPPHVHHEHDELFYIIKGTYTFIIENQELQVPAGSVVFVPRGLNHSFKHSEGASFLGVLIPGGMEGFFREMSEAITTGRNETEFRATHAGKYDSWPVDAAKPSSH